MKEAIETLPKVHYRPNRPQNPPKRTGHSKYSYSELKYYFRILLGNKCVICGSLHDLEIHHIKGLLASPIRINCKNKHSNRSSWKFYFKELEISLKNNNLELRCKKHHNPGKLHNHLYDNQSKLSDF
jgi:hypothetical protein